MNFLNIIKVNKIYSKKVSKMFERLPNVCKRDIIALCTFTFGMVLFKEMISLFLGLSGGPLDSEYELLQFHAHWGSSNDHGSEHTVDGRAFAAEVKIINDF